VRSRWPAGGGSVIVQMRTKAQAARVAKITGGRLLHNDQGSPTNKVALDDFEVHREAVESVSVLFRLFADDDTELPSGWVLTGATFEVEWPKEPERRLLICSHFGARRFAKNWAIERVKADLEAKQADPDHVSVPWTLPDLRKRWNQVKGEVAPWWGENSSQCYSAGIEDAVAALKNWSNSKNGRRKGRQVGFPRFESKKRAKNRVRFTTGAMRLEPDRRHLTLPVIGTLRSKENTRRVQRHVAKGNARILSITLSERWGRLFVSIQYAARTKIVSPSGRTPTKPQARAGVDLGLRVLATIADTDGNIFELPNPKPLRATLAERRRVCRQLSRRIPGSRGHRRAKAKLARLNRRAVCVRRETVHQLTRWLVDTYGEVVIEDLDVAALIRSRSWRAFRRSVADAGLGAVRPTLAYKAERGQTTLTVADRLFPATTLHHGCGGTLVGKRELAKILTCEICGEAVDRDHNAAKNLRDWPETHASPGAVGASALSDPGPPEGGTDGRSDGRLTDHRTRLRKTSTPSRPRLVRREPKPTPGGQRNPARGTSE
jgi:putative transposase